MTHRERLLLGGFVTKALRAVDQAIGDELPTDQALAIIKALKAMRTEAPKQTGVDYLERLQTAVRARYRFEKITATMWSTEKTVTETIDTPAGPLTAKTYQVFGVWQTAYRLNGNSITIAEIRAAGLAQRPTTRKRTKK